MEKKKIGLEIITLGHLLKREKDRSTDELKERVLGADSNILCSDLNIIGFLAENQEKEIYQKDIENYFSLTAPSVSNKLKLLQQKNLIDRVYSKKDTRLKQVIMTDKAFEVDKLMRTDIEVFEKRISDTLTAEEKNQLITIIDKLKNEFE